MTNGQLQQPQDEAVLMSQLKEILLREDRSALDELQRVLNEKQLLAEKVSPIVEDHLDFLRHNFPKEYAQIVNRMVEQKLKSSQTEILDVIYPVMGKMINKYISLQFQEMKDSINARIDALFSKQGVFWWIRNRILGINDAEMLLAGLDVLVLEEIFVIQRDSGLLLGSAALHPSVNRDVVAGMLTAAPALSRPEVSDRHQGTSCPMLACHTAYQSSASKRIEVAATASRRPSTRRVPVTGYGREGWRITHA